MVDESSKVEEEEDEERGYDAKIFYQKKRDLEIRSLKKNG